LNTTRVAPVQGWNHPSGFHHPTGGVWFDDSDFRVKVRAMFNVLIDTSVWLDIAKDQRQTPLLGVVEEMLRQKLAALIVPRVVLDEFRRNRHRIITESTKSLSPCLFLYFAFHPATLALGLTAERGELEKALDRAEANYQKSPDGG
jgi:PIN domain